MVYFHDGSPVPSCAIFTRFSNGPGAPESPEFRIYTQLPTRVIRFQAEPEMNFDLLVAEVLSHGVAIW